MKQLLRILLGIIFCFTLGCGGYKHPNFPNVRVNFWVYPNDVLSKLIIYHEHEYFTGGVNGIVVYRLSEWEFTAFDRACPFDWDDPDAPRVSVEDDGMTLKCEKCGTLYNILDGGVIIGSSQYPLKQYYTNYDGMRLRVHN